jgi:choline dehydrogenase-like flavoprotein
MGRENDSDAVVDPRGRVRGIEGLRVADASIMPEIPRANIAIPTIMLAEKISDHVLQDHGKSHARAGSGKPRLRRKK